jgi:hypothetical protein
MTSTDPQARLIDPAGHGQNISFPPLPPSTPVTPLTPIFIGLTAMGTSQTSDFEGGFTFSAAASDFSTLITGVLNAGWNIDGQGGCWFTGFVVMSN